MQGAIQSPIVKDAVKNATVNVQPANVTDQVPAGPSLGGAGSNEILTPPNIGNPIKDTDRLINTGTGALNQSIGKGNTGSMYLGPNGPVVNGVQTDGAHLEGFNALIELESQVRDTKNAEAEAANTLGGPQQRTITDPLLEKRYETEVKQAAEQRAVEESGNALQQSDPFNPTAEEESAGALSEPAPGTPATPQEEAAEGLGQSDPNDGSGRPAGSGGGSGSGSGSGTGSIVQDPTKGGPGLGVNQAVEAAENLENVGNSFGGFEGGASPFGRANVGSQSAVLGEGANTGVVRSLSTPTGGTKGGANIEVVQEGEFGANRPSSTSAKVTGAGSINALESELEAGGGARITPNAGKVRLNTTPVLENQIETPISVPRR